ncbi:hypothetical protein [Streptomyces sp. NBC_00038]|uniref:hypothetical protein n=1 Tax=Streptomyces sp. NBC_00038 TaxID=2903615 RepID=UPI002256AF54|nr:hypothetical protein [Streptomyces sp. NBC_00038]MCX5562739.1 hypothetical protein [Streptomyces sp. NBC_00038]MCX5563611.1 hypothetical protein [Streptomyces sp. NBC_00038]
MQIDWESGHGPFTAPISAAGSMLAASYAANSAGVTPWWGAGIAGAGLVGSHIAGRQSGAGRGSLVLRAAAWVGAGAWCSWALNVGPWTMNCLSALAAGAVGLGAAMAGNRAAQRRAEEAQAAAYAAAAHAAVQHEHRALAGEWSARFSRVSGIEGVQVVGVEMWDQGGFTLEGRFPEGGYTWRDMQRCADGLAGDARLPNGCSVEITEGIDRGSFLANVETVNLVSGNPKTYPADYSPRSYNDGLQMGTHRDGSECAPVCRQLTGIGTGRRGSGKSNLMHVWIAGQVRMVDALVWVVDLNGGGLALPWLRAWHRAGRPGRPPIDWVADTPEKVRDMAGALLRIAKARKPGYADLMIEANDDKLPVSPEVPAIITNADEIAELYSNKARRNPVLRQAGDWLIHVVELARAVACNLMMSALRATQDVLEEPQLVVQSGLKVGMQSDEREINYLMGWNDKISPEDMPEPGTGVVKELDAPARPFQAYRITPAEIAKIVVAVAEIRPELDELSRLAAGEAYERRWENTDHLFGIAPQPAAVAVAEREQPVREGWADPTADWDSPGAQSAADVPISSGDEALADADAAMRRIHERIDDATARGGDADLDAEVRGIFEASGLGSTPPELGAAAADVQNGERDDPRKQIVFEIVLKAGPAGIGPEAIRDVFARLYPALEAPHAATIGRWLGADPRVHRPKFGRYAVRPSNGDSPS